MDVLLLSGPEEASWATQCRTHAHALLIPTVLTLHAQTVQFGFSGALMTSNGQAYGICASQDRKKDTPLLSGKVVARKG